MFLARRDADEQRFRGLRRWMRDTFALIVFEPVYGPLGLGQANTLTTSKLRNCWSTGYFYLCACRDSNPKPSDP
jgi:hypothetical protein